MTENQIKEEILKIIRENRGINAYGIVSKLSKKTDYVYDKNFHHILFEAARDNDIRVEDKCYYPRTSIMVEIKLESGPPMTLCYRCECLKYTKDACTYGVDKDKINDSNEFMCALDPTIRFHPTMDYVPKQCPINKAFKEQNGGETK